MKETNFWKNIHPHTDTYILALPQNLAIRIRYLKTDDPTGSIFRMCNLNTSHWKFPILQKHYSLGDEKKQMII